MLDTGNSLVKLMYVNDQCEILKTKVLLVVLNAITVCLTLWQTIQPGNTKVRSSLNAIPRHVEIPPPHSFYKARIEYCLFIAQPIRMCLSSSIRIQRFVLVHLFRNVLLMLVVLIYPGVNKVEAVSTGL